MRWRPTGNLLQRLMMSVVTFAERHSRVIIIGVAVTTFLITWLVGIAQSVWFDEAYTLLLARQPIDELLFLTSVDVHPPLYYLLVKGWASLFGWSDVALRALGGTIMALIVILAALLTKKAFGLRTMLAAVILLASSPFLLRYGFELRMYAFATLIGLAATYVMFVALSAKRKQVWWWLLYGLLIAMGLYTVYYVALLWIAHAIWLMARALKTKQPIWRQKWWLGFGVALVLFLPWLKVFVSQMTNGALAGITQVMTVENLIGIVSFMFLNLPVWRLGAWGMPVILVLIVIFVWLGLTVSRRATKNQKHNLWLFAAYIGIPVVLITLISLLRPFYVERYIIPEIVGAYILLGASLVIVAKHKPQQAALAGLFMIAVHLIGIGNLVSYGNYNYQRLEKATVRQTAAAIGECKSEQVVLADSPYVAIELTHYLSKSCNLYFYATSETLGGGYAPLSGSEFQVRDPLELADKQEIIYVHYEAALKPIPGFRVVQLNEFGKQTVEIWHRQPTAKL